MERTSDAVFLCLGRGAAARTGLQGLIVRSIEVWCQTVVENKVADPYVGILCGFLLRMTKPVIPSGTKWSAGIDRLKWSCRAEWESDRSERSSLRATHESALRKRKMRDTAGGSLPCFAEGAMIRTGGRVSNFVIEMSKCIFRVCRKMANLHYK